MQLWQILYTSVVCLASVWLIVCALRLSTISELRYLLRCAEETMEYLNPTSDLGEKELKYIDSLRSRILKMQKRKWLPGGKTLGLFESVPTPNAFR